jgi:hypothetical protein
MVGEHFDKTRPFEDTSIRKAFFGWNWRVLELSEALELRLKKRGVVWKAKPSDKGQRNSSTVFQDFKTGKIL